jgi:hypothetical protein
MRHCAWSHMSAALIHWVGAVRLRGAIQVCDEALQTPLTRIVHRGMIVTRPRSGQTFLLSRGKIQLVLVSSGDYTEGVTLWSEETAQIESGVHHTTR